jgi:hypothetical protein
MLVCLLQVERMSYVVCMYESAIRLDCCGYVNGLRVFELVVCLVCKLLVVCMLNVGVFVTS